MSDVTDLGLRLHLIGGAAGSTNLISGTYQSSLQSGETNAAAFNTGHSAEMMISVVAQFDAATAVTDIRFKLQGMPRGEFSQFPAASQWLDIVTLNHLGQPGTGATIAEQVYLASAGNTLTDTLMTNSAQMFYQLRVVAEATGAATKAGDIAWAWVSDRVPTR